jgi:hypothetical protein
MPVTHKRIHTGFRFVVGGRELIPDVQQLDTNGQEGEPTVLLLFEEDGSDMDVFLFDDAARRQLAQQLAGGIQIVTPDVRLERR